MPKEPSSALASERELSRLSGIDAHRIPKILFDAGLTPARIRKVAGREERDWFKGDALIALEKESESSMTAASLRDQAAHDRARVTDIKLGIKDGTLLMPDVRYQAVSERLAALMMAVRALGARTNPAVRAFNGANPDPTGLPIDTPEREAHWQRRAELFKQEIEAIKLLMRGAFPWQTK